MTQRIIARLDIKGPNLVKGIHLEGLRALGEPNQYAQNYYFGGADELIYMDVVASLYGRNSLHEIISHTAKGIFIPLTVGGGIRTIDDIHAVLRAGADKVSINTAAIKNPEFIQAASRRFGSSTVVVAIEAIRQDDGQYFAFTDNGRGFTGMEVTKWAQEVERLGAGEILLTSVDREGTGTGFDLELVKSVADLVSIPVVAHGGAGKPDDVVDLFRQTPATGAAISSLFHYRFLQTKSVELSGATEGNIDFLKSGRTFSKITPSEISTVKSAVHQAGIACRM